MKRRRRVDQDLRAELSDTAESRLIERLLHRDEEALREAMAVYGPSVFSMAKRILADAALAEEVAQDTFIALWRRPGAYDPQRGSLRGFLLGVTRNKAIDRVRKEESVRRRQEDFMDTIRTGPEAITLDSTDDRTAVLSAVRALAPAQQEAIVLAYFGGYTYRQVADRLRIPEGTAKSRLREGLTRLRATMSEGEA